MDTSFYDANETSKDVVPMKQQQGNASLNYSSKIKQGKNASPGVDEIHTLAE